MTDAPKMPPWPDKTTYGGSELEREAYYRDLAAAWEARDRYREAILRQIVHPATTYREALLLARDALDHCGPLPPKE